MTSLEKLVERGEKLNETKTNFFEGNVNNYAKGSIDMDF
jgi:ribonucleotide reductase beta subunit family protein with ferritin-like domain